MHIRTGTDVNGNDGCDPPHSLGMNQFTSVRINVFEGGLIEIFYDNVNVCKHLMPGTPYSGPGVVKIYGSDPWHSASNAQIRNLIYAPIPMLGAQAITLSRNNLLRSEVAHKSYTVSFDIKPMGKP